MPNNNAAVREIPGLLRQLDTLTRKYRVQFDRVSDLKNLIPEKLAHMQEAIQLRREDGLEPALAVVRTDRSKDAMEQIRRLSGEIRSEEYAKVERRSAASSSHTATDPKLLQSLFRAGIFLDPYQLEALRKALKLRV